MQSQGRNDGSSPSVSLVDIFLKAKDLERKGKDVIHFDAGEPDYEPPKQVVEATIRALREGKGRYTESSGIPEAKIAICENLKRKIGKDVSSKQVLVTSGGRMALYYAFTTLPKTSKIGIFSPDWPAYRDLARFMGYPVQFFQGKLENGWDVDIEEIKRSDCGAIVLNYPNNPTGKILDLSKFEEIIQVAIEKKLTVISDEVYSDFIFNNQKRFKSVLETKGVHYVFVTSLSKSYAMTGFRAAYVVSDETTTTQMSKLNGLIMTSAPEFVQYAIIAAMGCDDFVKEKVELIKSRRDVAVRALKQRLNAELYVPDGSLYIFPRLQNPNGTFDSGKFALEL
ncbi:MAG TPA: aminotransferase class I/II-fold pyridoxal phosphate-dependent enzyme, partial [Nitrososphaerales archaeon]|nr:aminotransferase class I/II-fold pyridoxal phosphate-dependent enzyme [Nitrososphaerales archaeon]